MQILLLHAAEQNCFLLLAASLILVIVVFPQTVVFNSDAGADPGWGQGG
jgi:uncharacterized membrane protein